jgi:hypothetical protein
MKLAVAIPLTLAAALTAGPSFAFPQIDTTNSETVSTVPPRYRATFTVTLSGYEPGSFFGFNMQTGTGPLVHFYDAQAPATWNAGTSAGNDVAYFGSTSWGQDGTTEFSVLTDQPVPCVRIIFEDPILAKAPSPRVTNSYVVEGCLQVDAPTPAHSSSWGSVKASYR